MNNTEAQYVNTMILSAKGEVSPDTEFMKSLESLLINPESIELLSKDELKENNLKRLERIDICKIDTTREEARNAVFKILDGGFRPSLFMIRFEDSSDTHVPTQLTAGHLQNVGYILMGVHEDKYLYYFTNDCMYDYCSWDEPALKNPLMEAIIEQTSENLYARVCKFLQNKHATNTLVPSDTFNKELFYAFFPSRVNKDVVPSSE